jgi:2-polyprenyl-6-methoxyphenol hydroxylase-like FAD-dependent oxidoreductase
VVVTTGSGELISTPWLIAADGASSRVRGLVGLDFQGLTWPHNFIATNVRSDSFAALGLADNNYVIDPAYGSVVARITKDGLWRVTWAEGSEFNASRAGCAGGRRGPRHQSDQRIRSGRRAA